MKTTRIILLLGLIVFGAEWIGAQVKIGERPLQIGNERLLEMQSRLGELLIVTDSLELGITTSDIVNNPNADAMMLKLYGYGLGNFGGNQSFFLGTNANGEVMEFPITLDLVTTSSTATLSIDNGTSLFTQVDLTNLDSVFSTNNQLTDSINTLRTLVNQNRANDLDTIQINELIDEIRIVDNIDGEQTILRFYEDQFVPDDQRDSIDFDLDPFFATDDELADTAAVLRDLLFYIIDGTLTSDRTVTGASFNLTFTDIDSMNMNGINTTITSSSNTTVTTSGNTSINTTGTTDVTSAGNVGVTSTTGTVTVTSTASDILIDASMDSIEMVGVVQLNEYPSKPIETDYSNVNNILGIDAAGNIVNVDPSAILGTETDSVIYRHDGTLISDRTLTGAGFNLTFTGVDSMNLDATNTTITSSSNTSVTTSGNTSLNTTGTTDVSSAGNVSVTSTTGTVSITSTASDILIDASTDSIEMIGVVQLNEYPAQPIETDFSNVNNILGIDAAGNVINVDPSAILGTETDSVIYRHDGSLISDRTLTGAGFNLTFTGVDSMNMDATNTTITSSSNTSVTTSGNTSLNTTGTTDVSSAGDVSVTSTTGTVSITSTTSDILIDASTDSIEMIGVVQLNEYPSKPIETDYSNINNILGIDADGNVVNVDPSAILGTQTDSVIYRHDGTLTQERYMTMDGNDLNFLGATASDSVVITANGQVGIGTGTITTGTANGVRLHVNGDILAMQVHSSSDERFKKNIAPVSNALDKVMAIDGVTYEFRNDEFKNRDFPTTTQLGFIAQNVEEVVPHVVKTDGQGYKSVDYSKLTALLNEAIKEQQKEINSQKELITAQQNAISTILEQFNLQQEEIASLKNSLENLSNQTMSEE